jgi:CRP-like cAMP-binding protein
MHLFHRDSRPTAELLSTFSTFQGCTIDDLIALVEAGHHFELPAEWVLMSEGIPADATYVITDGTASVYKGRSLIAEVGPGDVVGEMSFLAGGQRRATVTSKTHVSGIHIEHEVLAKLLKKKPHLAETLTAVFKSRVPNDPSSIATGSSGS